ncbi:MAG: hypothetical protein A4E64_02151 [Syntrophorhabdus sp. PtaU1.Bin058]|nr:MAG: hypothetical protein A4E64_02151 [Syntrophorhabdus sp. PtaU1.Bin058]
MNEPLTIHAGETTRWSTPYTSFSYIDADGVTKYPKASEWTLTYYAKNATSQFSQAAAADGDDYLVTIAAAASAAFTAGDYTWMAYVHKGAGETLERYLVASGTFKVIPSFANTTNYDNRSFAKKMVDAIEAWLVAGSQGILRVQIDGKTIEYQNKTDIVAALDKFGAEYEMEQRTERISKGLGHRGRILMRFTG